MMSRKIESENDMMRNRRWKQASGRRKMTHTSILSWTILFVVLALVVQGQDLIMPSRGHPRRNLLSNVNQRNFLQEEPFVTVEPTLELVSRTSLENVSASERIILHALVTTASSDTTDTIGEVGCDGSWTLASQPANGNVDLSTIALTSLTVTVPPKSETAFLVPLILPSWGLSVDGSYQFAFTCGTMSSHLTLQINSVPSGGYLDVSPSSGIAFVTSFLLSALSWMDEDLPLRYEFVSSAPILQSNMDIDPSASEAASVLIGIADDNDTTLSTVLSFRSHPGVRIWDSLSGVSPLEWCTTCPDVSQSTGNDLTTRVSGLQSEVDSIVVETDGYAPPLLLLLAMEVSVLADCTNAPTDCDALFRLPCGAVPHSCGECQWGYVGQLGPGNTPCQPWDSPADGGKTCSLDSDCNLGLCLTSSGQCTDFGMAAPEECSGTVKLTPRFGSMMDGSATADMCMSEVLPLSMSSTPSVEEICEETCRCTDGYFGPTCDMTAQDMDTLSALRVSILSTIKEVAQDMLTLDPPLDDKSMVLRMSDLLTAIASVTSSPMEITPDVLDSVVEALMETVSVVDTLIPLETPMLVSSLEASLRLIDRLAIVVRRQFVGVTPLSPIILNVTRKMQIFHLSSALAQRYMLALAVPGRTAPPLYGDTFSLVVGAVEASHDEALALTIPILFSDNENTFLVNLNSHSDMSLAAYVSTFGASILRQGNSVDSQAMLSGTLPSPFDALQSSLLRFSLLPMFSSSASTSSSEVDLSMLSKGGSVTFSLPLSATVDDPLSQVPEIHNIICGSSDIDFNITHTCEWSRVELTANCEFKFQEWRLDCPHIETRCLVWDLDLRAPSQDFICEEEQSLSAPGVLGCRCFLKSDATLHINSVQRRLSTVSRFAISAAAKLSTASSVPLDSPPNDFTLAQTFVILVFLCGLLGVLCLWWAWDTPTWAGLSFGHETSSKNHSDGQGISIKDSHEQFRRMFGLYVTALLPSIYITTTDRFSKAIDQLGRYHPLFSVMVGHDVAEFSPALAIWKTLTCLLGAMAAMAAVLNSEWPDGMGCVTYREANLCVEERWTASRGWWNICEWNSELGECVSTVKSEDMLTTMAVGLVLLAGCLAWYVVSIAIEPLLAVLLSPSEEDMEKVLLSTGAWRRMGLSLVTRPHDSGLPWRKVHKVGVLPSHGQQNSDILYNSLPTNSKTIGGIFGDHDVVEDRKLVLPSNGPISLFEYFRSLIFGMGLRVRRSSEIVDPIAREVRSRSEALALSNHKLASVASAFGLEYTQTLAHVNTEASTVQLNRNRLTAKASYSELRRGLSSLRTLLAAQSSNQLEFEQFDASWGLVVGEFAVTTADAQLLAHDVYWTTSDATMARLQWVERTALSRQSSLKYATEGDQGIEIISSFVADILGGDTVSSQLYHLKFSGDFRAIRSLPWRTQAFVAFSLVALNTVLAFLALNWSNERIWKWEVALTMATTVSFLWNGIVIDTLKVLWCDWYVPLLADPEVDVVRQRLLDLVRSLDIAFFEVPRKEFMLDVPEHLFVSRRLAAVHPSLPESKLIRRYFTNLPSAATAPSGIRAIVMSVLVFLPLFLQELLLRAGLTISAVAIGQFIVQEHDYENVAISMVISSTIALIVLTILIIFLLTIFLPAPPKI